MPDILRFGETLSSKASEQIVKLFLADCGGKGAKALTAEELLELGKEVFEPLFHQPPLGPIPEYLKPHSSVYGCVAEYEDKLEELERWKAGKLNVWLKDNLGKKWWAGDEVYQLYVEKGKPGTPERYLVQLLYDES